MAFISGGRLEGATGGTISTIGGYKVHTFDTVGLNTFIPSTNGLIEVLVVGGGSAGSAQTGGSGGGGGGSVLYTKVVRVSAGVAYTMNIGSGGINGNLGTNSVINLPTGTVTAFSGDVGIGSFGKFVFSSVPSSINEGSSGTFNVTTDKFPNGTTVFWTINHITTVDADFGSISGSFVVNNDAGSFSVPIANDQLVEGSETFTVSVRTNSPSGTFLSTSPVVAINNTTLVTTASTTIVNEGQSVTFTTQAQGFTDGTTLYYDIVGGAGVAATDFTSNSLSGTYTVSSGVASTTITASADGTTENDETFQLGVKTSAGGSILTYSPIVTMISPLFSFTSFTFTNAGLTGFAGPTLTTLKSSYNTVTNPWLLNTSYFNMVTQGLQLWTVPSNGYYTFTVTGASGGNTSQLGGTGCKFTTNPILLTKTHVIRMIAGQVGQATNDGQGSGGGGGSVVYNETTSSLIAIAGGGGGAGNSVAGLPAPSSTSGAPGLLGPGSIIGNGGSGGSAGGPGGSSVCGFSAAGWNEDGPIGLSGCGRASDFTARSLSGPAIGGDNENITGSGGFGGAGGGANNNGYGGGGGGYSGGGGGGFPGGGGGGGGGSYSINGQNTITTNTGGGFVVVTYIQ